MILEGLVMDTEVIMALIKHKGYEDQDAFADKIGMNHKDREYYLINRRTPTSAFIEMLCHHLDCQPATFLSYGEQPYFMARQGLKLTHDDCNEIIQLRKEGYSVKQLAEKYGVSDSRIRVIAG